MKRSSEKVVDTGANPDLDIFSPVFIQTAIKSEQLVDYFPISPLQQNQPIQFDVPESFMQMTAPNFLLKIKAKMVTAAGAPVAAETKVAPTNLTLHSMFKDITLKVNGVMVNQASGSYPYRAYIETNYTYSQAAKEGAIGIPQMYYQEKSEMFENFTPGDNPSYDKRRAKFIAGNEVEMAGRLHCDLLLQPKLIVPGVRFSAVLMPASNAFRLISDKNDTDAVLIITSAVLRVKRVNLSGTALLSIERAIQQHPAKYPIARTTIRIGQVVPRQTYLSNFVVNSGQVPRLVLMTLLFADAYQGTIKRNSFNFILKYCKSAQLEVNGILYPPLPYKPTESWMEPYLNSLQVVNKLYTDSSSGLTFDEFLGDGHPILTFDLHPADDVAASGLTSPRTNGVLTLNANFEPKDDNFAILLYLLWDNIITIDGRKNVILDYVP